MNYPCPCCGYLTSSEPGGYDICPVCGWEDDISQLRFPKMGGANESSLIEAQKNTELNKEATSKYEREEGWRPIDESIDTIEDPVPGKDYGTTYPSDSTELYYWRKS